MVLNFSISITAFAQGRGNRITVADVADANFSTGLLPITEIAKSMAPPAKTQSLRCQNIVVSIAFGWTLIHTKWPRPHRKHRGFFFLETILPIKLIFVSKMTAS